MSGQGSQWQEWYDLRAEFARRICTALGVIKALGEAPVDAENHGMQVEKLEVTVAIASAFAATPGIAGHPVDPIAMLGELAEHKLVLINVREGKEGVEITEEGIALLSLLLDLLDRWKGSQPGDSSADAKANTVQKEMFYAIPRGLSLDAFGLKPLPGPAGG